MQPRLKYFNQQFAYGPNRIDERSAPFYSENFTLFVLYLSKISTSTSKLSLQPTYNRLLNSTAIHVTNPT